MDTLRRRFIELYRNTDISNIRDYIAKIDWSDRLIGIKGARGVGKTTLIMQHIKSGFQIDNNIIYVSLDDLYFTKTSLVDFTENFITKGGKFLFLDEVHRYKTWGIELKNIYDSYPGLQVVFTGSSILHLRKAKADLSRRAVMYEMPGLSFREFLNFETKNKFPVLKLDELLKNHTEIAIETAGMIKPLQYFADYLRYGFYPYYLENINTYHSKLREAVGTILEIDIPQFEEIDITHIDKLKRLLLVVASSVPFKPNIEKLSKRISVSRRTLKLYLNYLEQAKAINMLRRDIHGIGSLTKPDKIYLHNTNLLYNLAEENANIGNVRETFFYSQLQAVHRITYAQKGDFVIDDTYTFEIGGKGKSVKQIAGIDDAYVVTDDIEIGFGNTIPLWLFGFLY